MLDVLRKGAQTWVAKLLLILLVLSFGVWGISGSIFSAASGNAVVTVGDSEITANEFRLAYNRVVSLYQQQFGARLTTDQLRALGIEQQVYARVAGEAALNEQARRMNLGLSKDRLAALVGDDPAFQGPDGKFDRQAFSYVLRQVGMSESDYITSRSQAAVRAQIFEAVTDGLSPPDTLVSAMLQYDNEARTVDYLFLTSGSVDPVEPPSDDVAKAYFEENKETYRAPEFRKIAYLPLTADTLADPEAVSDERVREDYEARKDRYRTPEKRTIEQLVFSDSDAAEAASAGLRAGTTFEDLMAEQNKTEADVRLGTFTKEGFPDPAIAEATFALPRAGMTTDVVDGAFGPVILRVSAIEEESVKSFDEVKDEIRQELALSDAADALLDAHDAYEDARAGGSTFEEAAASIHVTPTVVEAIDRTGRAPDGTVISDIPESPTLLREAFETETEIESPPINIGSDGFVWYEVKEITPARDRTFDEVRDRVIADWTAEQTAEALGAKATELKDRLEAGEEIATVAADAGLAVETKYGIKRGDDDAVFGNAAISAAFGGPVDHIAVATDESGEARIVMKVTEVADSAVSGPGALNDQERQALATRSAEDLSAQLIAQLQTEYGVSVNQNLGEQALAGN